jgi:hypothetical protein
LKVLQPAKSETEAAVPLSSDDSFVEAKTWSESLQMRILDPVRDPAWAHVVALHRDAGCFHRVRKRWVATIQAFMGTEEDTIDYFRVDSLGRQCLVAAPSDSGLHTKIFGRLPLVFNRLAGSMIYPHLD